MAIGDKIKKLFSNSSVSSSKYNSIGNYNVPNSSYNASNDLAVVPKIQNTVQESSPGSRGSGSSSGSLIDNVGDTRSVGYTLDPEGVAARQFQLYMSNTAHQREVADLKAAGLNPVLSANGGANGYSAATGQNTDLAEQQLKNNLLITAMNNNSAQRIASIQAGTNMAIAELNSNTALRNTDAQIKGQLGNQILNSLTKIGGALVTEKAINSAMSKAMSNANHIILPNSTSYGGFKWS